jgi:ketosteroid isomerase-like protein
MHVLGSIGAVVATAVLTCSTAIAEPTPSPEAVITAERAFAAEAQDRGWIAAFKKFAAPDAVVFQPDPVNAQASLASRPDEPADRSLKWWPIWAGISRSGDLGFTTGPYTVGDTGFGHYFTVWAKQGDGSWRWVYDGGPRNDAKSPFGPATEPAHLSTSTVAAGSAAQAWREVTAKEETLAVAARADAKAAYLASLSDDARIMGSREQPAVGRIPVAAELDRRAKAIEFSVLGGRASIAGDLVFTYGDARWSREGTPARGHYVRIWQMRREGWVLVFDELLVAPPARPKP